MKAAAKPKAAVTAAEATGLVVAGPSNLQALTEDGKELPGLSIGTRLAGKELFAKAVRKVGLTTKLMPKKEAVTLPALTVVGKEGTEEREASPFQWRPVRKASSVLRQSSSLGELDGRLSGKAWEGTKTEMQVVRGATRSVRMLRSRLLCRGPWATAHAHRHSGFCEPITAVRV